MNDSGFVIRFPDGAFNWGPDNRNGFPVCLAEATVYATRAAAEAKAVDLGDVQIVPVAQASDKQEGSKVLDIHAYYTKLANDEAISEDELVALLKELAHFRLATAYLASCQAATLESLPKAASKSTRGRHIHLCEVAAAMLEGDASLVPVPERMEAARDRCLRAIERQR